MSNFLRILKAVVKATAIISIFYWVFVLGARYLLLWLDLVDPDLDLAVIIWIIPTFFIAVREVRLTISSIKKEEKIEKKVMPE